MKTIIAVLLIILICFCNAAAAADIAWEKSYDKAREKAKKEKKPLMIVMLSPRWQGSDEVKNTLLKNADIIENAKKFVCILVENSDSSALAKKYPSESYPYIIFISDSEDKLFDTAGMPTVDSLKGAMGRALSAWEAVWFQQARKEYQKVLDKADKLIEEKKYKEAIDILIPLTKTPEGMGIGRAAQKRISTITNDARAELDEAREILKKGEKDEAIEKLKNIYSTYKGTPISEDAEKELIALGLTKANYDSDSKEAKAEAAKQEKETAAAEMLAEAKKTEADKKPLDALKQFRTVASKYPDTKAGAEAAGHAKRLESDKSVTGKLEDEKAERKCKSWLSMAKTFIASGENASALSYLKKIVDNYPDTKYADEAKKLIKEISGK